MSTLIDGRAVSKQFEQVIAEETIALKAQGITPTLVVVIVGDDQASHTYVNAKARAAGRVGINSSIIAYPSEISEETLLAKIQELNDSMEVDGILVQLPLPGHIDEAKVIEAIVPEKDVDGFHPVNVGRMLIDGVSSLLPCTPYGIVELLKRDGETIEGKHAVIVGRSNIVGKPVAALLIHENATVTICHSRTKDLASITKQADILVVAMGRAGFITEEFVNDRMVVIDVGMNRLPSGKLVGDISEQAAAAVRKITPVPGGVGPMTISMLMKNTVIAAKRRRNQKEC